MAAENTFGGDHRPAAPDRRVAYQDCAAELAGDRLTVRNSKIERTWRIAAGGPVPLSVKDGESGEILTLPETEDLCPAVTGADEKPALSLEGAQDDDCGFAPPHLLARLTLARRKFALRYEFAVYPGKPVIRTRISIRGASDTPLKSCALLDALTLREKHCEWRNVSLRAVTDFHNNLVRTETGLFYRNETDRLSGNILRVHRTLQNDGIILIKEAPADEEQVRYIGYDFTVASDRIAVSSAGFLVSDLKEEEWVSLYGTALCRYRGGDEAFYRALREYHEARHAFRPEFDGAVTSNTWGDDSGGRKIGEDFLQKDLDAAHECGVTRYQIDAGWDTGETDGTGRSLWKINSSALPHGLERLRAKAERYGMKLGLWFVPYTEGGNQYGCYREDAQTLIGLHRDHGADFFKLDGFKLTDYTSTCRFEKMMRLVLEGTGNSVFFNVDITNWPRTGFLGAAQYGNLFFENRYTDRLSYYPHATLRNVWMLSRYLPAYRLQAEFLNVARNAEKYEAEEPGDALAPSRCGQVYALAGMLFASPLVWMEPSSLGAGERSGLKELLNAAAAARSGALRSPVLPIGEAPNGAHFTGFQAAESAGSGWLLFLREACPGSAFRYGLYGGAGKGFRFTRIVSNCGDRVWAEREAEVTVSLDRRFGFAVYRYEKKEPGPVDNEVRPCYTGKN